MIMIIMLLINIAIIAYIYINYYKSRILENQEKETSKAIDPMILGYINDKEINNNFDLILAEIIKLNIKGLLIIEYDKRNINKYNYKLKANYDFGTENLEKYELIILEFLFSKNSEITKDELEKKLQNSFNSYNVQYNDLQLILKKHLIEQDIIDENKSKEIETVSKKYKRYAIIVLIIVIILSLIIKSKISFLYINIYIIEYIIIRLMLEKASNYTEKGNTIKEKANQYKKELEGKEFLLDKSTMNDIVLNEEFAYSLALHINTEAKKIFINEKMTKNAMEVSRKVTIKIIIVFIIFIVLGILLSKITKSLGKTGIPILYSILAIIIATWADITKMLGTSKKRN